MNVLKLCFAIMIMGSFLYSLEYDNGTSKNQPQWIRYVLEDVVLQIKKYAEPGGIVGLSIKDLDSGEVYSINGKKLFNPASVIKIPVMVEAFNQIEKGIISMDTRLSLRDCDRIPGAGNLQFCRTGSEFTVSRLIESMITDSDNTATHMLIEKLGKQNINLTMYKLGLRHTIIKDPTMLCKKENAYNLTTPEDMLLLMDMIYKGKVVSPEASVAMIEVMKRQHHKWGIARFLPPGLPIANKTGSLDFVRNDVGIILNNRPYIVSIFCKNLPSNRFGSVLVGAISKVIYDRRLEVTDNAG